MKLATIGTGSIVELAITSLEDVEDVTLIACYSRSMEKAVEFGEKFGFEKAYDNLEYMMEDPDVDTVYIASPNSLHVPQARMALEHGKNVILEKPFAATVQEAKELFDLAESRDLLIFEAITSIHTPNFGLLKDQMNRIGNVKQIIMNFSQYSSRYNAYKEGVVTNVFDPAMQGGALGDINIYNIHFVDSPELLANVVCHELIHTLPGCTGHGPQFKQAARRMRHKGYDIETRATEETLEKNGVEAPVIKTQPYRYALICQECGKMYKRKKWSKALEYPEHYRCTCGGHLKAYRLTEEPETGNPQ